VDGDGRSGRRGVLREYTAGRRADSDEELEAEIARTEVAIDDCFWRRAKRVGKR
jgi:hypothetical protein